jgi:peptidoglycan/xylan/chitin deacetylase (PgdA/CDA1 family)
MVWRVDMLILGFHELNPFEQNRWVLSPIKFRELLQCLHDRGWIFQTLSEAAEAANPSDKRVAITFDDCRRGAFNFRYILAEFKAKATFFVCPALIEGDIPPSEGYSDFMRWYQVKQLSLDGHELGSHGMTHCEMACMPASKLKRQVYGSLARIAEITGVWCDYLATPYGSYSSTLVDAVRHAGYAGLVYPSDGLVMADRNKFLLCRAQIHSPIVISEFCTALDALEQRIAADV